MTASRSVPWARLLPALLTAAFLVHVALLWTMTEDAYIGYRYAQNLARGYGLLWNPGEAPVEGYTNFLWLLLLAPFFRLGVEAGQILGVGFAVATLLLTIALARRLPLTRGADAWLAPAVLALSGPFATWASSGMETPMFTFLLLLGFARHVDEHTTPGRWPVAPVVFALAAMTRPEGAFVFALTLAHGVVARRREGAAAFRDAARRAVIFLVPFGAYVGWRFAYYGFALPNTFYAKVGGTLDQVVRGIKYVGKFAVVTVVPLVALVGGLLARRTFEGGYCVLVGAAYVIYVVAVGGDYMAMFRFLVPVLPFLALLVPRAVGALAARLRLGVLGRAVVIGLLLVVTVLPSLNLERLPIDPPPSGPYLRAHNPTHWYMKMRQVTALPRVLLERWHVNRLTLLGRWMRAHLPPDAAVAYTGIGAIGYFSGLTIHDMFGLTDAHIAHAAVPIGGGTAGHEKEDFVYTLGREPTYILYSRHFRAADEPDDTVEHLYRRQLAALPPEGRRLALERLARYEPTKVWLEDRANHQSGSVILLRLRTCTTDDGCRRCPSCARATAVR